MFEKTPRDASLDPITFVPKPNPHELGTFPDGHVVHALEAIAAALCRIDHRLNDLVDLERAGGN